jgi:hypothetical protein
MKAHTMGTKNVGKDAQIIFDSITNFVFYGVSYNTMLS